MERSKKNAADTPDRNAALRLQRERALQIARQKAEKIPLIRARIKEKEAALARLEKEPEERIEQAPDSPASREAERILLGVIRSVLDRRSREDSDEAEHGTAAAAGRKQAEIVGLSADELRDEREKRSIYYTDDDFIEEMERTVEQLNLDGKRELAIRLRFAQVRHRQTGCDLNNEKLLHEVFLPNVNTAFVRRGLDKVAGGDPDMVDTTMSKLMPLLDQEGNAFDRECREAERRNSQRKLDAAMEKHMLERQRNLLKKQELDYQWAQHDANAVGRRREIDPALTLRTPRARAQDYLELLMEAARRTTDERKRNELCLRAAIIKTQCGPEELVDTAENKRIYDSFQSWADAGADMSVEERVWANERVVAGELERLEIIVPEEMQLKTPEISKESTEAKTEKSTAPQRTL